MRLRQKKSRYVLADFSRGYSDLAWNNGGLGLPIEPSGLPAWKSNGGPSRGHPDRALPFSVRVDLPEAVDRLERVYLIGVFAQWADAAAEGPGAIGAMLTIGEETKPLQRVDLVSRRHYDDARDLDRSERLLGDGTSLRAIGSVKIAGKTYRVDELAIDVPPGPAPTTMCFRDLGTPASFVLFDIYLEYEPASSGCPFHSGGGGISLAELPGIMRVGDRVRFGRALDQLEEAVLNANDLDEARGEALTFIAVVTASMLEMGGSRNMHRVQLQTARTFDELSKLSDIAREARRVAEDVSLSAMTEPSSEGDRLMDRAMSLINRNFSRSITDDDIAEQLGLSTSHFRHLFKEATGQPFHKYLIATRLEHARVMLVDGDMPITQIANVVGFSGLSHFSRAFTARFGVSPTNLRRTTE